MKTIEDASMNLYSAVKSPSVMTPCTKFLGDGDQKEHSWPKD